MPYILSTRWVMHNTQSENMLYIQSTKQAILYILRTRWAMRDTRSAEYALYIEHKAGYTPQAEYRTYSIHRVQSRLCSICGVRNMPYILSIRWATHNTRSVDYTRNTECTLYIEHKAGCSLYAECRIYSICRAQSTSCFIYTLYIDNCQEIEYIL